MRECFFQGKRMDDGSCMVWTSTDDIKWRPLSLRLNLWNHSPTGFEWGYNGSGPAQLALAMLYEVTGDKERSIDLHQQFKREVVARLPKHEWYFRGLVVEAWILATGYIESEANQ
jgi:hypothetical protein